MSLEDQGWYKDTMKELLEAEFGGVEQVHRVIDHDEHFEVEAKNDEEKAALIKYIGRIHDIVVNCCAEYFSQYRRHVYVTPKSYLSFISMYKSLYTIKKDEISSKARNVSLWLSKIAKATSDVCAMKKVLLVKLEVGAKEAEIQKQQAKVIEDECGETAKNINAEKAVANEELQAALPFMEQAKKAAASLNKQDIGFVASLPKPHDLIKRIMDGISILLIKPLVRVQNAQIIVNKEPQQFIADSYAEFSLKMMSSATFIPTLLDFSVSKKDQINDDGAARVLHVRRRLQSRVRQEDRGGSGRPLRLGQRHVQLPHRLAHRGAAPCRAADQGGGAFGRDGQAGGGAERVGGGAAQGGRAAKVV